MSSQQHGIQRWFTPVKPTAPKSQSPPEPTAEQMERAEKNRLAALERLKQSNSVKRKREPSNNEDEEEQEEHPQKKSKTDDTRTLRAPSTPVLSKSPSARPNVPTATTSAPPKKKTSSASTPKPKKFSRKQKEADQERYQWLEDERDKDQHDKSHPDYDPSTLYIPSSAYSEMTPFEKQYWDVKKENYDTVIFFKKGKFYELYEKDAQIGKDLFDLKMTERVNMKMVGVPEGSFRHWASKFVAAGYKVGRVEQMETPDDMKKRNQGVSRAKGSKDNVVGRSLMQILTAGTVMDNDMIMDYNSPYLLCLKENQTNSSFGVSFCDVSTGKVFLTFIERDDVSLTALETLLQQVCAKEIVYEKNSLSKHTMHILKHKLNVVPTFTVLNKAKLCWDYARTLEEIEKNNYFSNNEWPSVLAEFKENELVMCAFGSMVAYLNLLKLDGDVLSSKNFQLYEPAQFQTTMIIDGQTLANLEILINNRDHTRKGSLIEHLDFCVTPFGKRLFRNWVCAPLRRIEDINARLDTIEDLHNVSEADELREELKKLPDIERMITKIHSEGRITKDAVMFDAKANERKISLFLDTLTSLKEIYHIAIRLSDLSDQFQSERMKLFSRIIAIDPNDPIGLSEIGFPNISELLEQFDNAFDHKVARNEHMICPNRGEDEEYDAVVDELAATIQGLDDHLSEMKKKLKCKTMAWKHLQKDRYQLDLPKEVKVPSDWNVVNKTKNNVRYYSPYIRETLPKLKELELKKEEVLRQQMKKMFKRFDAYYNIWLKAIDYAAELDCYFSLVKTSFSSTSCRPQFVTLDKPILDIKDMIHPCITSPDANTPIQPNDTLLGGSDHPSVAIVTGPNMGGKSSLLRQNCIAIIMAQLGCYVPAQSFTLSPVDRIFTRIGANDRIMAGESTFMVELNETSNIINKATKDSFVILDEIGRGTSTFDGMAIAYAVVQYLAEKVQCRTLFSTHYYNLTQQLKYHPLIAMYQMECLVNPDNKNEVIFLYKYSPGVCPKSYGMHVARMAGLEQKIIDRASQIAETQSSLIEQRASEYGDTQMTNEQKLLFLKVNNILEQGDPTTIRHNLRLLQQLAIAALTSYHHTA